MHSSTVRALGLRSLYRNYFLNFGLEGDMRIPRIYEGGNGVKRLRTPGIYQDITSIASKYNR